MEGVLHVGAPDVLGQVVDHLQKQGDFHKNKLAYMHKTQRIGYTVQPSLRLRG